MTARFPKLWLYLLCWGVLINWGLALHQYALFVRAYFTTDKAITLFIDKFHEANSEMIMLTFSVIVGTIVTFHILKCIRNEKCIYSSTESEQESKND
jgi:hypothetical protein